MRSPFLPWKWLILLIAVLPAALRAGGVGDGVGLEKISLPSGPGSIEGLGDAFQPQLNTGTSNYRVRIAVPPGTGGLQPEVALCYNAGSGNGHFGLGWSDGLRAIQRQTEKGLPTYSDADRFTMDGEELVPLSDGSYRTKNEANFRRIIRQGNGWLVYDKNGTCWSLGTTASSENPSRLVRPGGDTFTDTFKWQVNTVTDVNGNRIEYRYARFAESPGDSYCTEIRYSLGGGSYQSVAFDYEVRADIFDNFLPGFQVRVGRRCAQIRVLSGGALVRRYGLAYVLPAGDPVEPVGINDTGLAFSLLREVRQFDRSPGDGNYLPPLRFGYTRQDAGVVTRGSFANPLGFSLADPNVALADLNADGLPDFFYTNRLARAHQVCYNRGGGSFSPLVAFADATTVTLDNGTARLLDVDGDGRVDLVVKAGGGDQGIFSCYTNTTLAKNNDDSHPAWAAERSFQWPFPGFNISGSAVRSLDLDGDRRIDFMRTTPAGFVYYYNRGDHWEEDGLYLFGEPNMGDLSPADGVTFETNDGGPNTRVQLADMNGDRLLDLTRLNVFGTRLEVTFWPNKGRGVWGTHTLMNGTIDLGVIPVEDVFLFDVNGDGLADVVAVAYDHVSYWINQGDGGFSRRFEVSGTPDYIKGQTTLRQADLNGNGSTDLLWENWNPATGGWRDEYVDFTGAAKPNLLAVIDNGIGLRTEIGYATSTNFYTAALSGGVPWTTRLPFPVSVVARITRRFGLDLDALPGADSYVSDFAYRDGYYDWFMREFRGFAAARQIEWGDDRTFGGGPAAEINAPSLVTRMVFHTGSPDGLDNNGNNLTDEFDPVSGYEEEPLKGRLLWQETGTLTAEETAGGPFSGRPAADATVFSREVNTWSLRTVHDAGGGFAEQPFRTLDGRRVAFSFLQQTDRQVIEGPGTANGAAGAGTATTPVTIRTTFDVDRFGNGTRKNEEGVVDGSALGGVTQRFTATSFAYNPAAWIVALPSEISTTGPAGAFVAKTQLYYDGQTLGAVGARGLLTSQEKFSDAGRSVRTVNGYDAYGNVISVRDPDYGTAAGHAREYGYDAIFHTYVERETVRTGASDLVATAAYDYGGGVLASATDFNGNVNRYRYDSFYRLTGVVKPGDTDAAPTAAYEYRPGDPWRQLAYTYAPDGTLGVAATPAGVVTSAVTSHAREAAGGGTFDTVRITDGAGHALGTVEEGESGGQWVFKEVKRYTSRGSERDSYLPFYGGSPAFVNPPSDGARTTSFHDAAGRRVASVNPPEADGTTTRSRSRSVHAPLKTVLYDEENNDASSLHNNVPHVQYQDGLGRLVGVDETNHEGAAAAVYPTRYGYDLNDQLTAITDAQSNVKTMRYDGLKRLVFMNDPDRGVMSYTYDDASNLTGTVDARGQRITMTYDGANRLQTEDYLDAAGLNPDVAYFYDAPATVQAGDGTSAASTNTAGRLSHVRDLAGEEYLSYDARGRPAWKVKRVPDPANGAPSAYRSSFGYDSLDRMVSLGYPDGDAVGYTYNARSLPAAITGGAGGFMVSAMHYAASGQLASCAYGNGVSTTYGYDPRLRLHDLSTDSPSDGSLIRFRYSFDAASNILRIDDNRPSSAIPDNDPRRNTQVFAYDDLYRLTQASYPATAGQIAYGYDRLGNMLSQTSNIVQTENGLSVTNPGAMSYGGSAGASGRQGRDRSQPGPHALTGAGGGARSYPYDANGNMQSIDGLACTWDFKDRLVAAENAQMRAEYTYDYTDRRITKKVFPKNNGIAATRPDTTQYIDRAYEVREDGAPVKYVWNGDTRVARVTTNLNAAQRVQRFALQPGWNVLALAVTLTDGTAQLLASPVQQVYRQGPGLAQYNPILSNETLPAGTILRVQANAAGTLAVRGAWTAPAAVAYPGGHQWIANRSFAPLDVTTNLPANAPLWFFDALTQGWRQRLPAPLAGAGDHPSRLQPGEATFAAVAAPFTLAAPDAALEVRYYHQDHLGSSSVMSDANGQLVSENAYYPFGYPRQESQPRGVKESYGFTQKEQDGETKLQDTEARYLLNSSGRFASVDKLCWRPKPEWKSDPQRYNQYAYGINNPVKFLDPDGADAQCSITVWVDSPKLDFVGHTAISGHCENQSLLHSFGPSSSSQTGSTTLWAHSSYTTSATFEVSPSAFARMAEKSQDMAEGSYKMLTNNCTSTARQVLEAGSIHIGDSVTSRVTGFINNPAERTGLVSGIDRPATLANQLNFGNCVVNGQAGRCSDFATKLEFGSNLGLLPNSTNSFETSPALNNPPTRPD